jgi:hypothetical protein
LLSLDAAAANGRVVRWTPERVHLNKGSADGLKAGDKINVRRGRRRAGSCVVEHLADHHATCKGAVRESADRFRFNPPKRAKPAALPKLPAPVDDATRARATAAFAAARVPEVRFTADVVRGQRATPIEVGLRHQSWTSFEAGRDFHKTRVFASLRGVPLGLKGWTGWAHVHVDSILGFGDGARFFADRPARLEVYELAARYRDPDVAVTGAVGRLRPFNVIGMTVLDGAQGSWVVGDGAFEVGAYAGVIPELTTLAPRFDRVAGGAYWSAAKTGRKVNVRHLGRVGARALPSSGYALDAEALLDLVVGPLQMSAGARGVMGEALESPGGAALDLAWTNIAYDDRTVALGGSYRYFNRATVNLDLPPLAPTGAHHANVHARYRGWKAAHIGLRSDGHLDDKTGLTTVGVGPEITLPRFLGSGAVTLGYRESFGNAAGRTYTLGTGFTPTRRLYIRTHTTWFEDNYEVARDPQREVAQLLSIDYALLRWLAVRGSARGHWALPDFGGAASATPVGLNVDLTVVGSL